MHTSDWFSALLLCHCCGMVAAFSHHRSPHLAHRLVYGSALSGSVFSLLCACSVFISGPFSIYLAFWPQFESLLFRIDELAAFFLVLIGLGGSAASIYALGAPAKPAAPNQWLVGLCYPLFLLAMSLVVVSGHALAFLVAWELMSLSTYLLICHDHANRTKAQAALIYLIMTAAGTAFIAAAFYLLGAATGSYDFSYWSAHPPADSTRHLAFACAAVGFAFKAGLMPFHIWLPLAHPAAPSHVSALMSGVMVKIACYGLLRFLLEFLTGPIPFWWGFTLLLPALLSSALGILYAAMERDLKRLLAFSTVENIGIIFTAFAAALLLKSGGHFLLAGFAWCAALAHIFSHSLFKTLLFLGSGAVLTASHTSRLDHLGGLAHSMPWTAGFFLLGSFAAAAMPPLNGFIGEWLTLQTLFFLPAAWPGLTGSLLTFGSIAALGLAGGLSAVCFVKAFGISFLGLPRTEGAVPTEVNRFMRSGMALPAFLCLVTGLWPNGLFRLLSASLKPYFPPEFFSLLQQSWPVLPFAAPEANAATGPSLSLAALLLGLSLALLFYFVFGRPTLRTAPTWACGILTDGRKQYTAVAFSQPIRKTFRWLLRPHHETSTAAGPTPGQPYFGQQLHYQVHIHYMFSEGLYPFLRRHALAFAAAFRRLQAGSVQLYIAYILVVTLAALLWYTRW